MNHEVPACSTSTAPWKWGHGVLSVCITLGLLICSEKFLLSVSIWSSYFSSLFSSSFYGNISVVCVCGEEAYAPKWIMNCVQGSNWEQVGRTGLQARSGKKEEKTADELRQCGLGNAEIFSRILGCGTWRSGFSWLQT